MTRLYLSCDSCALSVGADELAQALTAQLGEQIDLQRTSTRGMFWLEPLLEVDTPQGRVGYGPLTAEDLPSLLAADLLNGGDHPLCIGLVEQHPYLARQQRLTFASLGHNRPLAMEDYAAQGGWSGLQRALNLSPQQIVDEVKESGLRGRGGAAFPTGIKWQTVLDAQAPYHRGFDEAVKFIVCNADEGDSGTFSDRLVMEDNPFQLIEGMLIAALATGATRGYIYLRAEYPHAHRVLQQAITLAEQQGYLGEAILGSHHRFHLQVRLAAGAYICGEETALLESLEGKRGMVRAKPPLPALEGLFGQPTVVNNVISLASVPLILSKGGAHYRDFGQGRSRGTMPLQLAGNIRQGGLVEVAFGVTLREILYDFGGGSASGRPIKAVQIGGPLGAYIPPAHFDTPLDYEALAAVGGMVGHGGIVVFDDQADLGQMAAFAMEFCALESCGKCTPCRIGSTRAQEVLARIRQGEDAEDNLALLTDLCDTMEQASLCALGGMAPYPVKSIVKYFGEELHSVSQTPSAGGQH
ncbi:formate dehydrogenase [Pokkaliibacter plantistimulans]|uniref:NADH-quinone oxidoreductase subunit F n=1 Tax=Pokkaliibacter plantistimulans TaxID=1635171 RepID=A0ABX5M0X1_9GAMM|nr:formate dehydrogenase beta subunit [Pokkaliibacter plantistimulans]PXF30555.1 formate dehydrogenase [Pokkaliibacter plantistimulans]